MYFFFITKEVKYDQIILFDSDYQIGRFSMQCLRFLVDSNIVYLNGFLLFRFSFGSWKRTSYLTHYFAFYLIFYCVAEKNHNTSSLTSFQRHQLLRNETNSSFLKTNKKNKIIKTEWLTFKQQRNNHQNTTFSTIIMLQLTCIHGIISHTDICLQVQFYGIYFQVGHY